MKKIFLFALSVMLLFSFSSCNTKGADGKTPYIQDGYWYIDGVNTGVKAEGVDGADGKDGTETEDNQGLIFYPQDDGTYVVSGGNAKYMKNLVIPEKYRGGDVVAIEENAFKDFSVLETLVIPNSVKKMGQGIFAGCTRLTSISMPCYENTFNFMWLCTDASKNSISSSDDIFLPPVHTINITGGTAIPGQMFYIWGEAEETFRSTLKTLTISDSITSIGQDAFGSCPDEIFEEENGIKYIGKWAIACSDVNFSLRDDTIGIASWALVDQSGDYDEFDDSITKFTVPASIKHLSAMSLLVSPYITEYEVESGNNEYCAVDGVVYTKNMDTLVQYPIAKAQETFVFPQSVKNISPSAFYGSQIKKVILPNGITEISAGAFSDCMLEEISIPNSVTKIGEYAFSHTNLETIILPEKITEIPNGAFSGSKLSSITIPSTVTKIGDIAFSDCRSLTSITLPEDVTEIGDGAFDYCDSLTSITLPEGVTEIADRAFYHCDKLASIKIPDGVTKIGKSAFDQCYNLKYVELPEGLKRIEDSAFYVSSLLSITLPKSLTYIGDDAFTGCSIVEVVNNSSLHIYTGTSSHGRVAEYAIEVHSGESKIVNCGEYLFYTYNNTNYLVDYTGNDTDLRLPENYNGQGYEIYNQVFYNRNEYNNNPIYSVIIPDCVTKIHERAFANCSDLKEIVIGQNVSYLEYGVFDWCSSLTAIYYNGTEYSWNGIYQYGWSDTNYFKASPRYYYSETAPTDNGSYWHYVNGVPTIW